jgi:DNA-binding NarL/FixJ family response regulator
VTNIGDVAGAAAPSPDAVLPAKVVIIDDDLPLCELLCFRLNDEADLRCAGVATSPAQARELVGGAQPAVIIVDIGLGRDVDAIDLVSELVRLSPASQVLIWTKWTDPSAEHSEEIRRKLRAQRSGASDWVAKGDGIEVLVERIREAVRRGPAQRTAGPENPIAASIGNLLVGHAAAEPVPDAVDHGLTPAELRAARATAHGLEKGMNIEQVAKTLKISIQTLRAHLRSIYTKWNVHRQAEFVAEARRRGLG